MVLPELLILAVVAAALAIPIQELEATAALALSSLKYLTT
jgi:hypothetical protein